MPVFHVNFFFVEEKQQIALRINIVFSVAIKKTKAQRGNWDVQSFSVINAEDVVFRNSNVPDSLIPLFQHHSVWINSRLFERLTGKELPVLHD